MAGHDWPRLARTAANPQMRAALADIERAWTRLAIETEMMERTKNRGRAPTGAAAPARIQWALDWHLRWISALAVTSFRRLRVEASLVLGILQSSKLQAADHQRPPGRSGPLDHWATRMVQMAKAARPLPPELAPRKRASGRDQGLSGQPRGSYRLSVPVPVVLASSSRRS